MPQFEFAYWPGQIAWALIVFAVVYLVLRATILPRMRRTLEERSGRIQADMVEARRLRDEAEAQAEGARAETAEARAKALKTAADAKAKSAAEAAARNADLEKDLAARLAAAEDRIRASRDMALRQVPGIAGDTASALVEKLSGRAPEAGEIDRAAATAE